jgi:HEAT repeat protein
MDPNCYAKKALVRALVALDCDDAEFFLAGLRLKQMEPVWGGTADTAADVRASCAMGLVASGNPRALVALADLLYDPEPDARIGAVRAAACGNPREAELLLRSKIVAGDVEPAIIGECFSALLSVEPEESLTFVAPFLTRADDALRELAALAIGESRAPGALEILKNAWNEVVVAEEFRLALIRAAAVHRSEGAFDWLLSIAAEARVPVAEQVLEALVPYKHNARLAQRLAAVLEERGDRELEQSFEKLWKPAS